MISWLLCKGSFFKILIKPMLNLRKNGPKLDLPFATIKEKKLNIFIPL